MPAFGIDDPGIGPVLQQPGDEFRQRKSAEFQRDKAGRTFDGQFHPQWHDL